MSALMLNVRKLEGERTELQKENAQLKRANNDRHRENLRLRSWLAQQSGSVDRDAQDYQRGWRDGASHAPDYAKAYCEEIERLNKHIVAQDWGEGLRLEREQREEIERLHAHIVKQDAQIAAYEADMRARATVAADERAVISDGRGDEWPTVASKHAGLHNAMRKGGRS